MVKPRTRRPHTKEVIEVSKGLSPFLWHGVNVEENQSTNQAIGECPLCFKSGKFHININNGLWDCKSCGLSGNPLQFLREFFDISNHEECDYSSLLQQKKILKEQTLIDWQVTKSPLTFDWLIPGYILDSAEYKLCTLYRYVKTPKSYRLMVTPTFKHSLLGLNLFDAKKEIVFLCEGPWDAMALYEVLQVTKQSDYIESKKKSKVLLDDINVLAVPGANVFNDEWCSLFQDRDVVLLYDNDHPKGEAEYGAGMQGMRRAAERLTGSNTPPRSIRYIKWGDEKGIDKEKEDGFDVRDLLSESSALKGRSKRIDLILELVEPIPNEWKREKGSNKTLVPRHCDSWEKLIQSWQKAMEWTEGLDRALSVMLSCVISTPFIGDQLWCKIIGPPSCGKTTLCEALSISKRYIFSKDTLTGLTSGYQLDKEGTENMSMVELLDGKTLVINDGDTLMTAQNREQILSQLRAFYSRNLRSQFKNKMSKDYESISTTIIICGTNTIRYLDTSELGQRFIDCVVMHEIDEDHEDRILARVANSASNNVGKLTQDGESLSKELIVAYCLTGGYVNWLRETGNEKAQEMILPDWAKSQCILLGKFVAYMRARPNKQNDELSEREFAARLVSQLIRLAKCCAVVINKEIVDKEVMRRVKQCALDTAHGTVLSMISHIYTRGKSGVSVSNVAHVTDETDTTVRKLFKFLRRIKVLETFQTINKHGVKTRVRWRLTKKMYFLYKDVMVDHDYLNEESVNGNGKAKKEYLNRSEGSDKRVR